MVRKLEGSTILHGYIRAFDGSECPVVGIRFPHMVRLDAFQHHGTGLDGVAAHIRVVAGKLPGVIGAAFVDDGQLSLAIVGSVAFVYKAAIKLAAAGVGKGGKARRFLAKGSEVADAGALAGGLLLNDAPFEVMAVQVQQTAIVTKGKSITTHGVGLELAIAHEDDNGHTTLQTHRTGSIAILAVQAGFTGVAQRATCNLAILILNIVDNCATTHNQRSFVVSAAGNGHCALTYLTDFLAGGSCEFQSQAGTLLNFKTGTGEGVISCLRQLPVTLREGESTGTHVDVALQFNYLLRGYICRKGEPLGVCDGIGCALARVIDNSGPLSQGSLARGGILRIPGDFISSGERGIHRVCCHYLLGYCRIVAGINIVTKALAKVGCP